MGYERRFNDALLIKDKDRFTAYMQDDQPVKEAYKLPEKPFGRNGHKQQESEELAQD